MSMGGICIGCTMPEFPGRSVRLDERAVGGQEAERVVRVAGSFLRRSRAAPASSVWKRGL